MTDPDPTPSPPSSSDAVHDPDAAGLRPSVPEALLHDLWQHQQFDHAELNTTEGRPLRILAPARPNADGGPDFREAALRIGETQWHGDVEIHTRSAQWRAHGHHTDARYNSTVLHVALHDDDRTGRLRRADGSTLAELVLYPHLTAPLRKLLHAFRTRDRATLPCAERWDEVPAALRRSWTERLAAERMEDKKARLVDRYLARPDMDALLHERLFAGLGYAPNAEPMAELARRLPLRLARTIGDPLDIEALHLGVAGLLPAPPDLLESDRASADYAMMLRRRFDRLQAAHDLPVMEAASWQFFRLRPANFPPLRIAQAAALLGPGGLLRRDPFGRLLAAVHDPKPVAALRRLLATAPGDFWTNHVRLERAAAERNPHIGRRRVDTLLVNAFVPVLLLHAEQQEAPGLEAALPDLLRRLPAGRDRVTRIFAGLGSKPQNAFEAQGLHQLYRTRCTEARCLTCAIGRHLLGKGEWERG